MSNEGGLVLLAEIAENDEVPESDFL